MTNYFKKALLAFGFNEENVDEFRASGCTVYIHPNYMGGPGEHHGDNEICQIIMPNGMAMNFNVTFLGTMDTLGQSGIRDGKDVLPDIFDRATGEIDKYALASPDHFFAA